MRTLLSFAVLALLAAPVGVASGNVFSDPACVADAFCVSPTVCREEVTCQANTCAPAADCHGSVGMRSECNEKPAIEGRTCETTLFTQAGTIGRDGGFNGVATSVSLSDGGVTMENLPNTWFSDGARVALVLGGVESGAVAFSVYRSSINSTNGFQATQYGAGATYDGGADGGEPVGVVVGVLLLDDRPESCYARVDPLGGASCPGRLPMLP